MSLADSPSTYRGRWILRSSLVAVQSYQKILIPIREWRLLPLAATIIQGIRPGL